MAHLPTWKALPDDLKEVTSARPAKTCANRASSRLTSIGSLREAFSTPPPLHEVKPGPLRARLPEVYAKWKEKLGVECWTLLEENIGELG
jgi:hypothetical protein